MGEILKEVFFAFFRLKFLKKRCLAILGGNSEGSVAVVSSAIYSDFRPKFKNFVEWVDRVSKMSGRSELLRAKR